jgi:hypothetical protein
MFFQHPVEPKFVLSPQSMVADFVILGPEKIGEPEANAA